MDVKEIKELVRFIEKTSLTEFEYESETERIYVNRVSQIPSTPVQQQVETVVKEERKAAEPSEKRESEEKTKEETEGVQVKTPIVGTFYEAPSPGAEPFVKEGDTVRKGQTLCIVEAMKIMNEIEAEFDCKILKKLGVNGEPVEYGEAIFLVEPL
ncbi:acetyl-CoA carboxylase biotin carboxyl carrier protein [Flexistipes sp.]|uniref:acetyl-CoA carboxylase biotin carboxyl carrier protein n=1 Tax=Flexistipes sp. TaxID=3088135 RepID=UPI002E20B212|nr:acetyl-CoA carboxylase biotin carboxyl carrier protein [Flexistipes sp.]